ncbi:MAG TPA: MATE family efflux transporter, partial [Firmicutes bacterium]|nr:MATE family efflux transporter [Bacillota bacterium]
LYTRIVSGLGTLAYAAHTIAINVESLSFMPGFGFSIAATTLIGQNLGANRPDVAERSGYESVKIGMLFMGAVGLILFFFPGVFVRLYTDDPEVTRMAVQVLRIVAISQPPMAAAFIFAGGLRGAGDTRWVMIITSASVWIVRLGLAYLLAITLNWQLVGAWIAMTVELFVRGTAIALRYRTGRWKKLKV